MTIDIFVYNRHLNLSLFQGYFHSKAFDSVITFKKTGALLVFKWN
ncbi:hypothetical protein EJP617_27400 [Erwinia sp. Ejp617]|nr:hypothetical protein EJP617_27400 [Erwinia sp. Ejp617]